MSEPSPWDEIAVPVADFNVRQVSEKTGVPCYWAKDSKGNCLFIVEIKGDHTLQFREEIVKLNGIGIDLRSGDHEQQRIILSLQKQVDRDIFEALCNALIFSLRTATDSATSLAITFAHLRRWKAFLAGRNLHLSTEEIQGLFVEVTFLLELIDNKIPSRNAIKAWLGPERSHQDFIFGNTAVEIKSISGAERNSVRISSEDQLESLSDLLFLRIYRISSQTDTTQGRSLNELINYAYLKFEDADVIEEFDRKLFAYGYAPLPEYDRNHFSVNEVSTYRIINEFPRLIRSQLPIGVVNLSYDIKLENIEKYQCNEKLVFEGI
jgi:Putative  PD-(D/E)XK family member, (DUF4420)